MLDWQTVCEGILESKTAVGIVPAAKVTVTTLLYELHICPFKLLLKDLLYAELFPSRVGVNVAASAPAISLQFPVAAGRISHL